MSTWWNIENKKQNAWVYDEMLKKQKLFDWEKLDHWIGKIIFGEDVRLSERSLCQPKKRLNQRREKWCMLDELHVGDNGTCKQWVERQTTGQKDRLMMASEIDAKEWWWSTKFWVMQRRRQTSDNMWNTARHTMHMTDTWMSHVEN